MNPMNLLKTFMSGGGNPQQFISNAIGNNNNPMLKNLLNMAQNNDSKGVENFARNYFKEQGRDFDKEFKEFMSSINKNS